MTDEVQDNQDIDQAVVKLRPKSRYFLWYGGIAGLTLVTVILAFAFGGGNSLEPAPNFSFTLYQGQEELGGQTMELADLKGKPVVLNFWAGLCPPCRAEMPDLQLFYEEFQNDVTLIGIDLGQYTGLGTQNDALRLMEQTGVTYPTGFTNDASVALKYEVLFMPTTIVINSKGEIFERMGGLLTFGILTDISNKMLAQESS